MAKAAKATKGTTEFDGTTYTVSTSFEFASFYRCTFNTDEPIMIRFHRTEKSAQKGTWDSPAMKKGWAYLGYALVQH